jgi:hypothetical protein
LLTAIPLGLCACGAAPADSPDAAELANAIPCGMLEGSSPFEPGVGERRLDAKAADEIIRSPACEPASFLGADLDCTFEGNFERPKRNPPRWKRYIGTYRPAPESFQGYWGDWCRLTDPIELERPNQRN